jgi:phosphoglycolate phosphatase-like HAD superfamily hydrolase
MISLLIEKEVIFWDFDGVIKESDVCKAIAFESLFLPYGEDVSLQVRRHHDLNGGMSRFDKIPIYLNWAGLAATESLVNEFCIKFSELVYRAVLDSPAVPGVVEYLEINYKRQYFVLLTATPQEEIENILRELNLSHFFREIYGSPFLKSEVVHDTISRLKIALSTALVVGDSEVDYQAAIKNNISFILRRTKANHLLQETYLGPSFNSLDI